MKEPACPNCAKAIQSRHTYMTTFPLTLICAGCGSWLKLDAKRPNGLALAIMGLVTISLAYFSLYFLILLPLFLVLSVGPMLHFTVELIKKRKAELWTINRRTGGLRPYGPAEQEAQRDLNLSDKLTGVRPFDALSKMQTRYGAKHQTVPAGRETAYDNSADITRDITSDNARDNTQDIVRGHTFSKVGVTQRPKYDFKGLPTGLPQ